MNIEKFIFLGNICKNERVKVYLHLYEEGGIRDPAVLYCFLTHVKIIHSPDHVLLLYQENKDGNITEHIYEDTNSRESFIQEMPHNSDMPEIYYSMLMNTIQDKEEVWMLVCNCRDMTVDFKNFPQKDMKISTGKEQMKEVLFHKMRGSF